MATSPHAWLCQHIVNNTQDAIIFADGSIRYFLHASLPLLIPHNHLIQCPIVLRTAQRQHLIAVDLVPPGPRGFEPYVTNDSMPPLPKG